MSTSLPQILIPIDFSEPSLTALDQAGNLAKFYNAELTLLHVLDDGNVLKKVLKKNITEEKEIEQKFHEHGTAINKKHNIKTNILIDKGRVYDKILKNANKLNTKLIMMGTYGPAKGLKNKFIGSNALRIVREAECPVITIKAKQVRDGCKNIVLPIDLTKESREKVKNAIEFGKLYGATIHVVSILYTLDKDAANRLTKQVNHVQKFIEAAGVNCTTKFNKVIKGKETRANAIINFANKINADVIMIMTQQEGERKPLFIGSTAQNIIHNSDIPVMSIVPTVKRSTAFSSPY